MPQLDRAVAKERAARLREAGERALARHLEAQLGKRLRVLTERGGIARAEDFTPMRTPDAEPGLMLDRIATGHDGRALTGAPVGGADFRSERGIESPR